jgi:hemerythrin-like domain-containing protein
MEGRDRRAFLTIAGAGVLLAACRNEERHPDSDPLGLRGGAAPLTTTNAAQPEDAGEEIEVTATEDLMREHGVIRRALVVYRESAVRLRAKPQRLPLDALQKTAKLVRSFAEDYHERQLEEPYLFPAVRKARAVAPELIDALTAQHDRGREITSYVLAITAAPVGAKAEALARMLEGFARMYEEHAAFEDTVVFPAWKKTVNAKQLREMSEQFERIEHETFGKDGFDDAVEQITAIEKTMGFELAGFTPAAPPKPEAPTKPETKKP